MKTENARIPYIDSIKGFAIILVVFAHVAEKYYKFDLYPSYTLTFQMIYDIIYSFHMPLFMIISGFLFRKAYYSENNIAKKDHLKEHWLNLAIVYTYVSILTGLSKLLFQNDVLHPIQAIDLALIWMKPIGHLWYLHLLLILYIVNYYICKSRLYNYRNQLLLVIMILAVLSSYIPSGNNMILIKRNFYYELFFYIGMMLADKPQHPLFKQSIHGLLLVIAVGLLISRFTMKISLLSLFNIVVALGLSSAIIDFFKCISQTAQLSTLKLIGLYSLELYLFHQFPVTFFQKALPQVTILGAIPSLLINFVLSSFLILFGVWIIRKVRAYNLLIKPYTTLRRIIIHATQG